MRMRSVTWPGGMGSSKTTYLESATLIAYSLYNFMGLRWRLRGVYMEQPHCKAVIGRKKYLQNRAQNGGFQELRGVNIKFLFSNPEEAHPCAEPRRLTYYAWESVRGFGCGALEEPQKEAEYTYLMHNFEHTGKRNPLRDHNYISHVYRYPELNHVCNFWWQSVKGFGCGKGSNFPFSHWLASSPLQHSRTTV